VNNAGVALGGTFEQTSEADFDWLMEINFHGLVRMTRAFLPLLHQRPQARIVNISSLFGLISPPGQTAYSASKFAVRGFSNALRLELEKTNVGVTVAHPGGIATAIARSARVSEKVSTEEATKHQAMAQKMLRMPPDRAAEIIVRAVERNQARVLVGLDAKVLAPTGARHRHVAPGRARVAAAFSLVLRSKEAADNGCHAFHAPHHPVRPC
jgi:short-subunit dehydrogenase